MASFSTARGASRGERGRAWRRSSTAAALIMPAAVIITTPLLLVVIMLVATPSSFAAPPVPPQCVYTGFAFQMSCSPELEKASLELTGKASSDPGELNNVDVAKLRVYLDKQAPPPSKECCQAGRTFNDAYCLCAPAMIKEFSQWVNMNQLTEVALFLEKRCNPKSLNSNETFTLYMEPNCPVRPVYTAEMEAAEKERLAKGIVPIEERVKEVSTGKTTTTPNATTTTPNTTTTTPNTTTTTPNTTTTTPNTTTNPSTTTSP